ncbi:MAG: type I-C CRISPR-associated protein Cas5c [Ruminococcus sp.]|nr:type I-C CRISPR-associated protein Cas5c [Ruminococcus sp.]
MMHENSIEFEVVGDYALFSDPITRVGGEKFSYQIPTYESIKGVTSSIYWKPTFIWVIDKVRVMNIIQTETRGTRPIRINGGNDLSYYTYLKNVRYQVKAHFIWNENRPELECDRNENKHHNIARRMMERGGRRDIFLGTRECQAYVTPCVYGEGKGAYDDVPELSFGMMLHGITYPDEAYSEETRNMLTVRLWNPVMRHGEVEFCRQTNFSLPMERVLGEVYGSCIQKHVRPMEMKSFGREQNNFSGLDEFEGGGMNVMD